MYKQFDIVHILTTKGIKYVSGPAGSPANPNGNWSIIGFIENDAILAKDSTIVRAPLSDIRKVGSYDLDKIMNKIFHTGYLSSTRRQSNHGEKEKREKKVLGEQAGSSTTSDQRDS